MCRRCYRALRCAVQVAYPARFPPALARAAGLARRSRRRQFHCEWSPCRGSAQPIACGATAAGARGGSRELDMNRRGRRLPLQHQPARRVSQADQRRLSGWARRASAVASQGQKPMLAPGPQRSRLDQGATMSDTKPSAGMGKLLRRALVRHKGPRDWARSSHRARGQLPRLS